jgi:hypothetical protein
MGIGNKVGSTINDVQAGPLVGFNPSFKDDPQSW